MYAATPTYTNVDVIANAHAPALIVEVERYLAFWAAANEPAPIETSLYFGPECARCGEPTDRPVERCSSCKHLT